MVTRWGMSQQVGVVFADYRPGEMSLNMQRSDTGTLQRQACSLVADGAGRLLLNSNGMTAHRSISAMSIPAAGNSSITMGTLIDHEMQHILNEGYAMAHVLLSEHYDQLVLLADALMEYEQLDRSQFEALLEQACMSI
jgi:cell division protease FtsH